jgi:RHS repeat-associated protein
MNSNLTITTGSLGNLTQRARPGVFMAIRRELAQTRREPGARRREGLRRTLQRYGEGLSGELAWCSSVSASAAEAFMDSPGEDAVSRLVNLTDPRQLQTQFRYDRLNRVTEIADARQGITRFGYDFNGNVLSVQDAKAQPTSYTYDSMDRLGTRKDALNRSESYQYDPAGNLTQFTDRKTQSSTFTYDNLNRRVGASYADSSATSFTYDAVGRLTRATDSTSGSIDFFYDNLDRLILEVTPQGAVAYEYDAIGRRTKMTAAGQAPVTYQYDAASRLTQVAQGTLVVELGYDNANRRTSLMYPNGTSTTYTYDNASRLLSITHNGPSGVIEALTYAYDAAGNRTSLTRANGTASLLPNAAASATYDAANEQTSFAGATLQYDANGNLTNDGTNTYVWDARNRLVAMSGGATATFNYDTLGRRTSKTLNSVVSQFVYDGNDVLAEIGGGAVGASYLRSLNVDEPFIRQTSSGSEYYHADALGSSLALSNTQGESATTYAYEPFGKTTVTGGSSNTFQFTGRENDGSGLHYYRARYYDASRTRFTREDQILSPYGSNDGNICALQKGTVWQLPMRISLVTLDTPRWLNPYVYVVDSPVNFKDPSGLDKDDPCQKGQIACTNQALAQAGNNSDKQGCILQTLGRSCPNARNAPIDRCRQDNLYGFINSGPPDGGQANSYYPQGLCGLPGLPADCEDLQNCTYRQDSRRGGNRYVQ